VAIQWRWFDGYTRAGDWRQVEFIEFVEFVEFMETGDA
jgi:hypothetical protein